MKVLFVLKKSVESVASVAGHAVAAIWTFPAMIGAAMLIAWGAEAAQFVISQGMALAILAWLQTLPEFAVEAVIAWKRDVPNLTANFTGSLRLLVGLGWPLIYVTAAVFHRRKSGKPLREIVLEGEHSVEIMALFLPLVYFVWILIKGTLTVVDSVVLTALYLLYLGILNQIPPQDEEELEDMEYVPRKILGMAPRLRNATIVALFGTGGVLIYFIAEPFVESIKALALAAGISQFVFIQWIAPFVSEFPEKVSAFYWARKVTKAPMALMNMVSSNINQWTVLVAMIPVMYCWSGGRIEPIVFDQMHLDEIALTIAQSALGFMLMMNMRFCWYEAGGLFILWLTQFFVPHLREEIMYIYLGWVVVEVILQLARRKRLEAFVQFRRLMGSFVLRRPARRAAP
ncbi:MAG: hypothetical protein HYX75_05175 [Acidobacteria bacterium]|nr:hypothetical protein [Acidobacteriota bacterium]